VRELGSNPAGDRGAIENSSDHEISD
jgi:hypothetical protein